MYDACLAGKPGQEVDAAIAPMTCPLKPRTGNLMNKPANPGSEKPDHHPPHPDVPPGPPTNLPNPGHGAPKPPGYRPVG
jgi:hypothetical protein